MSEYLEHGKSSSDHDEKEPNKGKAVKRVRFAEETEIHLPKSPGSPEEEKFLPSYDLALNQAKKPRKEISNDRIRALILSRLQKNEVVELKRDLEIYGITQEELEHRFDNDAHEFIRWGLGNASAIPLVFLCKNIPSSDIKKALDETQDSLELLFEVQIVTEKKKADNYIIPPAFKDKFTALVKAIPDYISRYVINFVEGHKDHIRLDSVVIGYMNNMLDGNELQEKQNKYKLA